MTSKVWRAGLPDMPDRIRALPVSDKGYPVPYFVAEIDGKPDFRVADTAKLATCVRDNRCWVCGQVLGRYKSFVVGPMCAINRVSAEPPSHHDCATFSATACPFLILPKAVRRDANIPEEAMDPAGIMITRNPGVALVWTTEHYAISKVNNGVLFRFGEPHKAEWYAQGRAASRNEVMQSIATGLPTLREVAKQDGPQALRELDLMTTVALQYVPRAAEADAGWYYLQFSQQGDPDAITGVAILNAEDMTDAIHMAWKREINPGGEIMGSRIPDDQISRIPEAYRNRLLDQNDLQALNDALAADHYGA